MNSATTRPTPVPTPTPVSGSKTPAMPAIDAEATKVAPTKTGRKADPIRSFTRPVERPSPPSVEKPAPVAALGDDDLMSRPQ